MRIHFFLRKIFEQDVISVKSDNFGISTGNVYKQHLIMSRTGLFAYYFLRLSFNQTLSQFIHCHITTNSVFRISCNLCMIYDIDLI